MNVELPAETGRVIFKETDKDNDALITYGEYFRVIEKYVCKDIKEKPDKAPVPEKKWGSKLRRYLWIQLRLLYEAFTRGLQIQANAMKFRELLCAILGDLTEIELTFLMNGFVSFNHTYIDFVPFAIIYFYLVAELGLSRYQSNHPCYKKILNFD